MDTPGIGGSGDVNPKLMEYLPNAVSFIFVINIDSAGGMQSDRVCIFIFFGVIDIGKVHCITYYLLIIDKLNCLQIQFWTHKYAKISKYRYLYF